MSDFASNILISTKRGKEDKLQSETPTKKVDAITAISTEISNCKAALAPKSTDQTTSNTAAITALSKAQDDLEKARSITAMTPSEAAANLISCTVGMAYASKLAFGNYQDGLILGMGGGMLASIGVGEGSNIFGPGKVLSQDVRAVLGNAAGGLLAASVSPNSLDTEMGRAIQNSQSKDPHYAALAMMIH